MEFKTIIMEILFYIIAWFLVVGLITAICFWYHYAKLYLRENKYATHYHKWYCHQMDENITNRKLIKAQREYIELLGDEIDDLVGVAHIHGWKTKRLEQGEKLRNTIKELE